MNVNSGSTTISTGNTCLAVPDASIITITGAPKITNLTYPANGTYYQGQTLTFVATYNVAVTVTGIPRLDLAAIDPGGFQGVVGGPAYATYVSGSGTTNLTFSYTVH